MTPRSRQTLFARALAAGTLLAAVVTAIPARSQGPATAQLPGLILKLQSSDWHVRSSGFNEILLIPHADTRPEVQAAFVQLLLLEEQAQASAWLAYPGEGPDKVFGEGYQDGYLGDVVEEVRVYAELKDSEDPATVTALLKTTAGDPASPRIAWLASRTSLSPSAVASLTKSPVPIERAIGRSNLAGLIIADRSGKRKLSDADRSLVKRALIGGLKVPELDDRQDAVEKIAATHDPDPDFIGALQAAASSDPSIRNSTIRAIANLNVH